MGSLSARCVLIRRLPSKLIRSASGSSQTSKQVDSWQEFSSSLAQPPSLLPASLSHSLARSLSLAHAQSRRDRGRRTLSLSFYVCVYDSLRLIHPPFIRHFPFSARGEGELLPQTGAFENICAWLVHSHAHTPTHTHASARKHTHTHIFEENTRCLFALW